MLKNCVWGGVKSFLVPDKEMSGRLAGRGLVSVQWRGKGSPTAFKTTTGTFYLNDGTGQVSDNIAAGPRSPLLGSRTAGSWEEGCQAGGNENPQLSPWWSRKRKPRCRPKAIPDFSYGLLASSCDLRLKLGGVGGSLGGSRRGGNRAPLRKAEPAEGGEAAERLGANFQQPLAGLWAQS